MKIFVFFFIGGLVWHGHFMIGGSPSLIPLTILLAGSGAVVAVQILFHPDD